MKRFIKKAGLAFIFLQVLFLNQAYAEPKGLEYVFGAAVFLLSIPTIAAFFILILNLDKIKRALIGVSVIWFLFMALITNFFTSFNIDEFFQPVIDFVVYGDFSFDIISYIPLTIIEIITLILYFKERYYPKENQE